MEHTIDATVTVTQLPSRTGPQYKNPGDVSFTVNYAEGYSGAKSWPNGKELTVSKEVAEDFTGRGIGHVTPEEKAEGTQPEELTVSKEVAEDDKASEANDGKEEVKTEKLKGKK